jgi:hypothetical protein
MGDVMPRENIRKPEKALSPVSWKPSPPRANTSTDTASFYAWRRTARSNGCSASPFAASGVNSGLAARPPCPWRGAQAGAGKPRQGDAGRRPAGRQAQGPRGLTFADAVDKYADAKLDEFRNRKHREAMANGFRDLCHADAGAEAVSLRSRCRTCCACSNPSGTKDRNREALRAQDRERPVMGNRGRAPRRRQSRPLERQPVGDVAQAREGGEGPTSTRPCAGRRGGMVGITGQREGMAARRCNS